MKAKRKQGTSQETFVHIKTKPMKSKTKFFKNKRKSKKLKIGNAVGEGSRFSVHTDSEPVADIEEEVFQETVEKPQFVPKIRRLARSENIEENFMIVPWASREEWENVCFQFHERNYKDVVAKIGVWQKRVPSLPVGVEATLFLLEALMYDEKFANSSKENVYTEDQARSLYSLAIIRYLNHVSQLATHSIGGPSKKLTRELAAIVDTPNWLVALRNDVSHGPSAPSIEVLRMGGEFVLQWLKEKYWKLPEEISISQTTNNRYDPFTVLRSNDVDVSVQIPDIVAAYIAARIYKMRKINTISDLDILQHIPNHSSSVKTKIVVMTLKSLLRSFIVSHPSLFCTIVSQELTPSLEFYEDFKSVIKIKEAESIDDFAFSKLYGLWLPIIKLLESKGKLITVINSLAELVINLELEKTWFLTARWIDKLLEIIENSGKKYSKHLVVTLSVLIKHPNISMHHFLERLFRLTEPRLGSDRIQKLRHLASIWIEDKPETKKRKKHQEIQLFTVSHIDEVDQDEINNRNNNMEFNQESPASWVSDERGEEFWQAIPIGGVL